MMRAARLVAVGVGLMAGPAFAGGATPVVGDVSLGFGLVGVDTDIHMFPSFSYSTSESNDLLKGYGRINVPFNDRWNFEFEATAQHEWRSGVSASGVGTNGHIWASLPNAALGAFAGISTFDSLGLCRFCSSDRGTLQSVSTGLEGEMYFGNLTLGGQASISWNSLGYDGPPSSSADFNTWQLRGYAAYYFTPDDMLGGEVKYTDPPPIIRNVTVPGQYTWEFIGRAEHRFAGTPFSVWAAGSYATDVDAPALITSATTHTWSALVGFRFLMDEPGSTLQSHDRAIPFHYDNHMDVIWDVPNNPV